MSEELKGRAREYQVAGEETGTRLDLFLGEKLACSRSEVRRMLRSGLVRLDGKTVGERAKGAILSGGQRLELKDDRPASALEARPSPENPLTILAQGSGWLALDKPAGTPVHPLSEAESDSLLNALIARVPEIQGVGEGGLRSGVVHRLDLDTSGVILFATEENRWQQLREAFKTHAVDKRYRALVSGKLLGEGTQSLWLKVAQHRPAIVREVEPETAGAFLTRLSWCCLETFDTASLLEVQLETGFLHQVRATLAHMGHPVLGDTVYGEPSASQPVRQTLHAASLEWGEIRVSSADPPDFAKLLASLREGKF